MWLTFVQLKVMSLLQLVDLTLQLLLQMIPLLLQLLNNVAGVPPSTVILRKVFPLQAVWQKLLMSPLQLLPRLLVSPLQAPPLLLEPTPRLLGLLQERRLFLPLATGSPRLVRLRGV